ncbi:hypothetical protein BJY04DRAFT_180971 [Aspergillus karnatakaensis]|uniref:uncharacterized protein n=1 Tax=Aspergillus karnatakaensis TaxID=1810916 RepID=UPI003CCD3739
MSSILRLFSSKTCTTPEDHCARCRSYYTYAREKDEWDDSDLLYKPDTFPVIFCHKVEAVLSYDVGDRFEARVKSWLRATTEQDINVYTETLACVVEAPEKGTALFVMIDFPAPVDPMEMIRLGMFPQTKVPHEKWQIEVPKEGDCVSAFRLDFFTAFANCNSLEKLGEERDGCLVM